MPWKRRRDVRSRSPSSESSHDCRPYCARFPSASSEGHDHRFLSRGGLRRGRITGGRTLCGRPARASSPHCEYLLRLAFDRILVGQCRLACLERVAGCECAFCPLWKLQALDYRVRSCSHSSSRGENARTTVGKKARRRTLERVMIGTSSPRQPTPRPARRRERMSVFPL